MEIKLIKGTHDPDGRVVDVKPILSIVQDVFKHFNLVTPGNHEPVKKKQRIVKFEENVWGDVFDGDGMLEAETLICIQKVTSEIKCKCGGDDVDTITSSILKMLSRYSWEAKVAISLAAVALVYGEFSLVVQQYHENGLAKSIAILKKMTELIDDSSYTLNSCFKSLVELNGTMLDVTLHMLKIIELTHLHPDILSEKSHVFRAVDQNISNAAYHIIRSVVACVKAVGTSYEYFSSTIEKLELEYLACELSIIFVDFEKQIKICNDYIEEKRRMEEYRILVNLFKSTQLDNLKILRQLICVRHEILSLVRGGSKTMFSIEVFKKKPVLLLITDLDVSYEELRNIDYLYRESRKSDDYEILWIPMIDDANSWTEVHQQKFEQLQSVISCYTLHDPKNLVTASIRYIKEDWHFTKNMILVALDSRGKVVCSNALNMFLVWGFTAFPFTAMKEEDLWRKLTFKLDLFVINSDLRFKEWVKEEKYICVYGGQNIEWIRKFISAVKEVEHYTGFKFELVYIGKRNAKEQNEKITTIIKEEELGHSWSDVTQVSYFWTKLESMLYSKTQYVKTLDVVNDTILKEVTSLLSFDSEGKEWATIWHGSEMARAHGDTILKSLTKFEEWEENVSSIGFITALKEYLKRLHAPQHCSRVILPGFEGVFSDKMFCFECGKPMEKYLMYRCCTD